jgi:ABC-type glycerol-3-phosphate transport system substrate-binding protein
MKMRYLAAVAAVASLAACGGGGGEGRTSPSAAVVRLSYHRGFTNATFVYWTWRQGGEPASVAAWSADYCNNMATHPHKIPRRWDAQAFLRGCRAGWAHAESEAS